MRALAIVLLMSSSSCSISRLQAEVDARQPKVDDRQKSRSQASKVDDRQCVHLCTELLACQSDAYNRELDPDTCVDACLAIGPLEPPPAPCLVHHSCMYKLCIEHFAESEKSRLQAVRL
jgi:hypothetical protein